MPGLSSEVVINAGGSVGIARPRYDATTRTGSGRAPVDATATIVVNGTTVGTATADPQGHWSFTFDMAPVDGQSITARAQITSKGRIIVSGPVRGAPLSMAGVPDGGTVGTGSTFKPMISGATAPYTLSLISGALPPGRSIDGAAQSVTGTYTAANSYSYVLRATDAK